MTTVTVTAQELQNVAVKVMGRNTPEEESLEAPSENRHTRCGRDMCGADCTKYGQQQRGRSERRRWTLDSRVRRTESGSEEAQRNGTL